MKDKRKNKPAAHDRTPRIIWTGEFATLKAEKLVPGGKAIARHEGQVVFVEGLLPGEEAEVELSAARGGFREARVRRLLIASPDRVEPACPHYGSCGGCDLQHLAPAAQRQARLGMLEDTLRRQGGYGRDGELPSIGLQAGPDWGYRSRMQFHARADGAGFGLMRRASHAIEPVGSCPVASPEISDWIARGFPLDDPGEAARAFPDGRMPVFGWAGRLWTGRQPGRVELAGRNWAFAVDGFFQSNLPMLERLCGIIRSWVEQMGSIASAADLYCGVGVFASILPESVQTIDAVDNNPVNCRYARMNTDPARCTVIDAEVAAWLEGREGPAPDLVVVDPPRTGLDRGLSAWIAAEKPAHVIFVSCDPVTFARDLAGLRTAGYRVRALELLDFYPQTAHVETACWLERG